MQPSLLEIYRNEILPRLKPEQIYSAVRFSSRGSHRWRGPCPLHGGDNPNAFTVDLETLRWHCFTGCARGGDALDFLNGGQSPKGASLTGLIRELADLVGVSLSAPPVASKQPPCSLRLTETRAKRAGNNLASLAASFAAMLPGSPGEAYLHHRKIPLPVAARFGIGYSPPGQWPHRGRDWKEGRVVFPHLDADGQVVNLYGRAIGEDERVPKAMRHAHLPGPRGYFRAEPSHLADAPLWVCEGPFDALSLLTVGCEPVVATFGVSGWRWDWARTRKNLIFALDADAAGESTFQKLAVEASLRGKIVQRLDVRVIQPYKDLNQALCAGRLSDLKQIDRGCNA